MGTERVFFIDWSDINNLTNANQTYDCFLSKFNTAINLTMPMGQKRVKCYSKTNKPWVTPAIIKSIHRKNSLYKRYLKTKSFPCQVVITEKYKKYKNKLTGIILLLKKLL